MRCWVGIESGEVFLFIRKIKTPYLGVLAYRALYKSMTKATFSMDIPTKAIKILSYRNDLIMDPFAGSATTCVAAEILDRRWVGIELSENYAEIGRKRVQGFVDKKKQTELDFEKGS